MANAIAQPKAAAERLEALARSASNVTMIKYNSGNWTISDVPVPPDTKFVIYPDQVLHSWTHFADNKVVSEFSAIVAEDEEGDVELRIVKGQAREDLGYDDQTKWELDSSGKPRDPLVYSFALPMMNAETGAVVVFKIASVGGMSAIAGQVASFTRNRHLGYPIVTVSTGSYKNKKHGGYPRECRALLVYSANFVNDVTYLYSRSNVTFWRGHRLNSTDKANASGRPRHPQRSVHNGEGAWLMHQ
jgi:hypothetical protein